MDETLFEYEYEDRYEWQAQDQQDLYFGGIQDQAVLHEVDED